MRRTAALASLSALVLAWSWLRLEKASPVREVLLWTAVLGVLPALLPRRRLRLAAATLAAPLGLWIALGTLSPREAVGRFWEGFLRYYDVALPFGAGHPRMHALVLLAVFGFALAVSLAVAERRPLLACALLVTGAGWPATLVPGNDAFAIGALILGTALTLLTGLNGALRPRQAVAAATPVVLAAVVLAGVPAVAKGAFLAWETWEPSRSSEFPVSVGYVWETSYNPLVWPRKKTTVFTVEAPPVSRYWRATTLDMFSGDVWLEYPYSIEREPTIDPLMPAVAADPTRQLRAEVKIEALQDEHLIGASVPVRFETDFETVQYRETGTATVLGGIPRGSTYTAWSYASRPSPQRLARARSVYPELPELLQPYLVVQSRTETPPSPPFSSPRREQAMRAIFAQNPALKQYAPLYEEARRVVGSTRSPYLAAVQLERWFRSEGGFKYDQDPPRSEGLEPLVDFVTRTKRGYCQHFAGAMALMLRYLGIPARVAAGFTSGKYDGEKGEWVVTDHDAHTWVEVWFRGFGWLPFDPTPGRGTLDGAYSSASVGFSAATIAALARGINAAEVKLENESFEPGRGAAGKAGGRDIPGEIGTAPSEQPSLLRLLAFLALGAAAGIALLKAGLRRARFLSGDPRKIAAACRRDLAGFLADQRVRVPESATLAELGELVRQEGGVNPGPFVDAVGAARFGPPERAREAARRSRRELRRLERDLRTQLSAFERARGLVSLRSLGVT